MVQNFDYSYILNFFPFIDQNRLLITYNDIPEDIIPKIEKYPLYSLTDDKFYINIPNIAKFLVNKDKIFIEKSQNASENDINFFLSQVIFPIYFIQNKLICLKGTALIKDGNIILLVGYGRGKSSVAQKLILEENYKLISDDYLVIENNFIINRIKLSLWEDIAIKLNYDISNLIPIRENIRKYFINNNIDNLSENKKVSKIFIFNPSSIISTQDIDTTGQKKFEKLIPCFSSIELLDKKIINNLFSKIMSLANISIIKNIYFNRNLSKIENIEFAFKTIKEDI